MEVSHLTQYDTHAVVGGGKAISFSMSASAEFFTVLSDTMYSNKPLAVVREVVCNAWDAHIAAGKTDVPIEITITDDELIIEDFGTGIPNDKIEGIYCVYGASTKAKDDTQTGGFGLGSKAPFAYAQHFTVSNSIDGFKTIYAASRGSSETEGRPDFRAIATVPTKSSGIKVTIPLTNKEDGANFNMIAKRIVKNGMMNAKINGELQTRYDGSGEKLGFVLVDNSVVFSAFHVTNAISVRYGSVVYGVDMHNPAISSACRELNDMIPGHLRVLLFAPAGKIGVTPSRESLSYTEITITTINALINNAIQKIKGAAFPKSLALAANTFAENVEKVEDFIKLTDFRLFSPRGISQSNRSGVFDDLALIGAAINEDKRPFRRAVARVVLKKFAKKFKDYRAFFRKEAGMIKGALTTKSSYYGNNTGKTWGFEFSNTSKKLNREIGRRKGKWLSMLIAESGAAHSVFLVDRWGYNPIVKCGVCFDAPKTILIGSNAAEMQDTVSKMTTAAAFKAGSIGYNESYVAFRLARTKTKLRNKIVALAEKHGVEIVFADPEQKKKAPPKPSEFRKIVDVFEGINLPSSLIEKPTHYLYGWRSSSHKLIMSPEHAFDARLLNIGKLYPTATLVDSAALRDKAIKIGATDLVPVMIAEAKKSMKNKGVIYGYFLELMRENAEYLGSRKVAKEVTQWSCNDHRIAQLFFPFKFTKKPQDERTVSILKSLRKIASHKDVRPLIVEMKKLVDETFPVEGTDGRIFKAFPGIEMLNYTSSGANDDLYETLVFMKKRGEKLAKAKGDSK